MCCWRLSRPCWEYLFGSPTVESPLRRCNPQPRRNRQPSNHRTALHPRRPCQRKKRPKIHARQFHCKMQGSPARLFAGCGREQVRGEKKKREKNRGGEYHKTPLFPPKPMPRRRVVGASRVTNVGEDVT